MIVEIQFLLRFVQNQKKLVHPFYEIYRNYEFVNDMSNILSIANNKQDYIDKAIFLSENIDKIEEIRNKIYENALGTPLFDQKKFVNHFFTSLEKLYN